MKKIVLLLIFMFLMPSVYACSSSLKSEMRIFANNVNFNLDYRIVNDNVIYKVIITGLNDDLYVSFNNKKYYGENIVIDNLDGGVKYKFDIYSDTYDFCSFGSLRTKSITTLRYNKYYNDPLCLGHEDNSVCYRWSGANISYDVLKKTLEKIETEDNVNVVNNKKNNIFNYLGIIVIGVFMLSCGIVILVKKSSVGF